MTQSRLLRPTALLMSALLLVASWLPVVTVPSDLAGPSGSIVLVTALA